MKINIEELQWLVGQLPHDKPQAPDPEPAPSLFEPSNASAYKEAVEAVSRLYGVINRTADLADRQGGLRGATKRDGVALQSALAAAQRVLTHAGYEIP